MYGLDRLEVLDWRDSRFAHPRATPEKALCDWLYLAERLSSARVDQAPLHRGICAASPLIKATEVFSIEPMNSKQMKKWLEQRGATFLSGKGSHLKDV